jgi:hypothetical protein
MKKLREWAHDQFWGFLVPLWILIRHACRVSAMIDGAEEMSGTWADMWGNHFLLMEP